MAGKKKGKGSKLARMSDEDRARYLQHRAELELEAKRRKQQLIAIFTKNKLKREEAFSRLNTAKINEQWRFILRQIKCKELYQNVEYLWKNFDRSIKVKDEIIRRLYNELKVADADHRKLQEAHIKIMDTIIAKQKQRLKNVHDVYITELKDIKSNDVVELNKLRSNLEKNCKEIQLMVSKKGQVLDDKLSMTKTQNAVYIYNILYLKENTTSDLLQQSFVKMENLWEQLNLVITEYEKATESKRKQYEYLKEQNDIHQLDVAQYPKLNIQLQSTLETLKQDIETMSEKREKRITSLRTTMKEMKEEISHIRQEFSVTQTEDSIQLKKLSVISNNTLKDLQKVSEKGSTILQFIKMCCNLEPLLFNLKKYQARVVESSTPPKTSEPFNKLECFWEKYNHIRADNILLKKEHDNLSLENKKLRHTLRTYLLSVSGIPAPRPFTTISV